MNWVNHREMNSMLICCHFKKIMSFFSVTKPFVWCVTAVKDMKNMDHLITFTASLPWLPIIHFRPIRWVRPAPQWGPSSSCRFHPPTTLTRGSSLTLPLNDTRFHRRSHLCRNRSSLTRETIRRYSLCAGLQHCRDTELNQKPFDKIWT